MNRITIALAVLGTLAVPASAQKKYGEIRPDTAKVFLVFQSVVLSLDDTVSVTALDGVLDLHDAWERLPKEKKEEITKSSISQLEIQRDIFVFHCMIGCRVGDLVKFTPTNIINGHVSYIARKTTKERVDAIEVPLNTTAKAILEKYWDGERTTGPLLPFISPQKYND